MTAGCDPWKTPYVVTVSHMAEMVEEIQTELLAATEELFRERREKGNVLKFRGNNSIQKSRKKPWKSFFDFHGFAVSTIILCFLTKQNHIRFSGFRHSSSGRTKRPSLRMSTSSNQISPPPYSGVMMSTKSQWIADLLPLGASS